MNTPDYKIVIPTRYGSTRFPGKAITPLNGEPMVVHTLRRAADSAASEVVVATDDERIAEVCSEAGARSVMTSVDHPSGTDRIAEVADTMGWGDEVIIVGLQGDEPATPAAHLDLLARNLDQHGQADMATLCVAIQNRDDYENPNRVKVVRDITGMALYFSRASIPFRRDEQASSDFPAAFIHVGLYAYRRAYLRHYVALTSAPEEREEQLEQLRVLHHGGRIHVAEVAAGLAHGVDRPEDVAAVERALRAFER